MKEGSERKKGGRKLSEEGKEGSTVKEGSERRKRRKEQRRKVKK